MGITTQSRSIASFKGFLVKLTYQLTAPARRLWWHTYAYTGIAGIMVLTVVSVIALSIHDKLSKALASVRQEFHPSVIE